MNRNLLRAFELEEVLRDLSADENPLVCQSAFHLREAIELLRKAAAEEQEKAA
jgi:hypothetical protein